MIAILIIIYFSFKNCSKWQTEQYPAPPKIQPSKIGLSDISVLVLFLALA